MKLKTENGKRKIAKSVQPAREVCLWLVSCVPLFRMIETQDFDWLTLHHVTRSQQLENKKFALFSHSQKSKMAAAADNKWKKDAADQNFDYMFKLLIIGNSSVGKTSFLFRYADDSFTSAFVSTVGIDFKVKTVFRNDKRIKLQIWDTGG